MRVMDGKPEYKVALVSFCLYLCGLSQFIAVLCIERPGAYCFTVCLSLNLSFTNLNCKLDTSLLLLNY